MEDQKLRPVSPVYSDWDILLKEYKSSSKQASIDIILPVYGAPDDTLRCLYSVLVSKNSTPFNLIVIDDCSPDIQLTEYLNKLSKEFSFEFYKNDENKGFVLTCNFGFSLHKDHDVILLNSDTEVFDGWLDKIVTCSVQHPNAGTITAMSNNATICSYPFFCEDFSYSYELSDAELSQLFYQVNGLSLVSAPTGVGFCMYIRRECLNKVGVFNYELFGKGYGEENDLCVRIEKAGWQNMIATGLFVRHYGSSSFTNSVRGERVQTALNIIKKEHSSYLSDVDYFIRKDPLKLSRKRVDEARLEFYLSKNKPVCLHITHPFGGGTEKHYLEMVEKLEHEGYSVLSFKPNKKGKLSLNIGGKFPLPNLDLPEDSKELASWLKKYNISFIHIHHLKGYLNKVVNCLFNAIELVKIPYYFTVHDYYPICPRINLIDETNLFCGEPDEKECNNCVKTCEDIGSYTIQTWRINYERILHQAEKVFVPDQDVQYRLLRYFPKLKCEVRPHFDIWQNLDISISNTTNNSNIEFKENKRIGILGALGIHKGADQLLEVATVAKQIGLQLQFVVIGYTYNDEVFKSLDNVEIIGKYADKELIHIIEENKLDMLWFPAICPETYSYTLSSALASGLPIVAYDFGAIARRLHEVQDGGCVPLEVMLQPAKNISYLMKNYQRIAEPIVNYYQSLIRDYYGLS